jgi:LysR family transcriptional activator of dmlA
LVHILPEYYQPANIWAVYVSRLATSAKVRVTVEFLRDYFREHYGETGPASENSSRS